MACCKWQSWAIQFGFMGGVDDDPGWCVDGNRVACGSFVADGCAVGEEMGCTSRVCNCIIGCVGGGRIGQLQKGLC